MGLGTGSTSSDLDWDSIQPCGGGGSGTSYGGGGGGVCEIGLSVGAGMEEKSVRAHDLSEARRMQQQGMVIRGRGGDSCACSYNTSQYNINSYNTDIYIRYIYIHAIQTHTYIDQPAKIDLS